MSEAILRLDHVTSGYTSELPIVRDFSAGFSPGTVTTLVGPNGAGKSTLLRTIYGLTRLFEGKVTLSGEEIQRLQPWQRLSRGIGFVPQGRCNFSQMTVRENLELGTHTLPRSKGRLGIERVCERFPILRQKWGQFAGNLSGGEQQVLEMAMILQLEPRVLLLDEPTLGLSPKWHDDIFRVIREICDSNVSVVMVEQNVRGGLSIADRAIVMEQGRIVMDDRAGAILGDERIKSVYLGGTVEEESSLTSTGQS